MGKAKKRIIISILLIVFFLACGYFYLGIYIPAKVLSPPKESIYQNNAHKDFVTDSSYEKFMKEKTLHFIAKYRIAKKKYGFVKKIEIKQKSGVSINERLLDDEPDSLVFGIFRDSKCSEVIKKAQGVDLITGLNVNLEEGTYYIGIYTTDVSATYEIPVLVDCCSLYPKVTLKEKTPIYYCVGDKDQENTFSLVAEKTSKIRIFGIESFLTYTTLKNKDGRDEKNLTAQELVRAEGQLKMDPDYDGFWGIYPEFNVEKGKEYILEIKWKHVSNPEIIEFNYEYVDNE